MMLINGQLQDRIAATDRGLAYGDGLFETIAVCNGLPQLWQRHLNRLIEGCSRIGLPCPDADQLQTELRQVIDQEQGVVKIVITSGSGGRGYRRPEQVTPHRIISFQPYEPPAYKEGIRLYQCKTPVSVNSRIAGLKTLGCLDQVLAQSEWSEAEYQEGVMCDYSGNLIEGTKSNIFLIKNQALLTPRLEHCGIQGIMRDVIIAMAKQLDIACNITDLKPSDLASAEAALVCNSLIKIWPVRQYQNTLYQNNDIVTRLISETANNLNQYETDA